MNPANMFFDSSENSDTIKIIDFKKTQRFNRFADLQMLLLFSDNDKEEA